MELKDKAQEALDWFTTTKRADSEEVIHVLKDEAPEWISTMVRNAHGDFLPDDYRYSMIVDTLEAISESDSDEYGDLSHEVADGAVSVYTADRTRWLSSHAARAGYCDQASDDGLVADDAGIDARIGAGWYLEAQEVFESVLGSLQIRFKQSAAV